MITNGKTTVLLIVFLLVATAVFMQVTAQEGSPTFQEDEFSNVDNHTEAPANPTPAGSAVSEKLPMSSWEFSLSMVVLAFGLLVIGLETFIVFKFKGKIETSAVIQFLIVTLIITSTLFLITAGYGKDQIAPAMGLLGTIAGYLLGRSQNNDKESD